MNLRKQAKHILLGLSGNFTEMSTEDNLKWIEQELKAIIEEACEAAIKEERARIANSASAAKEEKKKGS